MGDRPGRRVAARAPDAFDALDWSWSVVTDSQDAIVVKDREGTILFWNAAAERLYGWRPDEIVGRSIATIVPRERSDEWRRAIDTIFRGGSVDTFETVRIAKGGRRVDVSVSISPVRNRRGRVIGASAISRDISRRRELERRRAEGLKHLEWQATHDPLTGAGNRAYAYARAGELLRSLFREGGVLAVVFIDVDNLKDTNDRFGHAAGDAVLRALAERLADSARPGDVVARLGGDEFLVIAGPLPDDAAAEALAQRLLRAVNGRVEWRPDLGVVASLGLATTGDAGQPFDELIAEADAAMYAAKSARAGASAR